MELIGVERIALRLERSRTIIYRWLADSEYTGFPKPESNSPLRFDAQKITQWWEKRDHPSTTPRKYIKTGCTNKMECSKLSV